MTQPDTPKTVTFAEAMADPRAVALFADALGVSAIEGQPIGPDHTMKDVAEAANPSDPGSTSLTASIVLYLTGYGGVADD